MIVAEINVETDGDFHLSLPSKIEMIHTIKYDGDYSIKLKLNDKTAKDDLINFLRAIEIDSSKEWHTKDLSDGIDEYVELINKNGLTSSVRDILGGGNWSFTVNLYSEYREWI